MNGFIKLPKPVLKSPNNKRFTVKISTRAMPFVKSCTNLLLVRLVLHSVMHTYNAKYLQREL